MRIYNQARGGATPALNAMATMMLAVTIGAIVLAVAAIGTLFLPDRPLRNSFIPEVDTSARPPEPVAHLDGAPSDASAASGTPREKVARTDDPIPVRSGRLRT